MAVPAIAFKTSIQIEGMEELRERFVGVAPREVNNILRAAVHGLAGDVRDQLKAHVTVRTHRLQRSIKAVRRRGKPNFPVSEVRGGATAPYMLMLEFGTKRTRAQPFIVPTVEQMRPRLPEVYREEFGRKFERALEKRDRKG